MNKSNKQNIYTAIGIALSVIIAFGGWLITSKLLDKKENAILSVIGNVHVDTPMTAEPIVTDIDTIIDAEIETSDEWPKLTDSEIYLVLQNWENDNDVRPHEPKTNQLNMEQAIRAAKYCLTYFKEQEIIPAELLEYEKTNAYLCEKTIEPRFSMMPPSYNFSDVRESQSLEPFYSYWTVTFTSEKANIILILNASTGQVWKGEVHSLISSVNFNKVESEKVLTAYITYLGLSDNRQLDSKGNKSTKDFADGMFNAVAERNSTTSNNDILYPQVSFYLSSQKK